jgi:hypothetical protein
LVIPPRSSCTHGISDADIAGRFAGSRTFIELLEKLVPRFYEQVGQHLRAYVVPPPRPRKSVDKATVDGATSDSKPDSVPDRSTATEQS